MPGPKTTEWLRLQAAGRHVQADLFLQLNAMSIKAEQEAEAGETREQRQAREHDIASRHVSLEVQRAAVAADREARKGNGA